MSARFLAPPVALTIAGSDCSGGAGIQADLKAFQHHSVYGLTVLTCVVAEVPGKVAAIQPVDPAVVREQIQLCLDTFPVRAIKTGLLHSPAVITLVAELYRALPAANRPPLVVDPVMVATSGDPLLAGNAEECYAEQLLPLAALVTPNLDEGRALLGSAPIITVDDMRRAARELCARFGVPFLLKGGHLAGHEALDVLVRPDGSTADFVGAFTRELKTHGTGCAYSAATAAGLANGRGLQEAITGAKEYLTRIIAHGFRWEHAGRRVDALGQ